jgi:hypothetical protein
MEVVMGYELVVIQVEEMVMETVMVLVGSSMLWVRFLVHWEVGIDLILGTMF